MSEDVEDRVSRLAETVAEYGETLGNLGSVTVELAGEVESSSSAGCGDGGAAAVPWPEVAAHYQQPPNPT